MSVHLNVYDNNNNTTNNANNKINNFKQAPPPPLPHQSTQLPLIRSLLFSKLTFNLSKGHYMFVTELLKTKSENQQCIGVEANANEIASNSQMWLQLETNKLNKKFLNGKTPLIICSYIKENDWCMSLTRLLLENGAYLSLKDTTNGCNPLHYACALLKCEQIELYMKNIDFSSHSLRDFNGNTPLIYFLISFSFYFNRISSPLNYYRLNSNNNNKNLTNNNNNFYLYEQTLNDETYLDDELYTNRNSNGMNTDRIYESIEIFQLKLFNTLRFYIDHLKRLNMTVNTINRLGYSLYDFYSILIQNNKRLENHEFFQLIKSTIIEEDNKPSLKPVVEPMYQTNQEKPKSSSQVSLSNGILNSKSSFLTTSQKLNEISTTLPSKLPTSFNELSRFANNKPINVKINLETFLKQNVLINLNDMKINKVITHSKKVDQNLLYLFLNKQIGGKYFKSNSISRIGSFNGNLNKNIQNNDSPKRSTAMDKCSLTDEHSFSHINFRSLENDNLPDIDMNAKMNNWRDSIGTFYDHLNIKESTSFRKGCKITYDTTYDTMYEKVQQLPNQGSFKNSNKIVSSSQNMAKVSKTQISKSISVSSSVNNKQAK
jgi:hypothetical protein